ncbi:alpha-N-methyltransferase NTM1 [Aspergillus avenaceus]|uniref:Alpha N-terminal protein methyltransferase 1 n=1 Tax=Aspergillus avenaceus TaxID=36643 RepID=A0A5N6TZM0_ASPAV|nr:alpha-N-methyltransferase NTM1 [Aspergillus avenaceus]
MGIVFTGTMSSPPSKFFSDDNPSLNIPVDAKIDSALSVNYWNNVPATVNGMLGGFAQVSRTDLRGSKGFLTKARKLVPGCPTTGKLPLGVDCGAGIGRVIEGFLQHVCDVVDAVEPVGKFSQEIQQGALAKNGVVSDVYTMGIERWVPSKKYDLIWTQWCVMYLTDAQLTEYLVRCGNMLTETGILVVKDNTSNDPQEDIYDESDSSLTRTDQRLRDIFHDAGMELLLSERQAGFPKHLNLLPVRSYAMRPRR